MQIGNYKKMRFTNLSTLPAEYLTLRVRLRLKYWPLVKGLGFRV